MRTETPVTLYTRSVNPATRGPTYARSVVSAAHWESGRNARPGKTPTVSQTTVYIPATVLPFDVGSISPGDVIVRGSVADELGGGFDLTDLQAKYPNVLVVTSVDVMDYGSPALRHWKVGAE